MRRKPLLLALTAIVCLALCVALVAMQLYVVSEGEGGGLLLLPPINPLRTTRVWSVGLENEGLWITSRIAAPNAPDSGSMFNGASRFDFMGFAWGSETYRQISYSFVRFPYWFIYTLLLVAPGGWVWGRYRRRRQGRGFPVILANQRE